MTEKLMDGSCGDFARALAAKSSIPGGGGASAYAGALAAALCGMAGNFTVGKKRYADVEEDILRLLDEAEAARKRLLDLVDEDARAFEPLSRAYGIPRDDPRRADVVEEATKAACLPPLATMEECGKVIVLLEEMGRKCSALLVSDIACGAYLAQAALYASHANVLVNMRSLSDAAWAREKEARCEALAGEYGPRAQACAQTALSKICGGE